MLLFNMCVTHIIQCYIKIELCFTFFVILYRSHLSFGLPVVFYYHLKQRLKSDFKFNYYFILYICSNFYSCRWSFNYWSGFENVIICYKMLCYLYYLYIYYIYLLLMLLYNRLCISHNFPLNVVRFILTKDT